MRKVIFETYMNKSYYLFSIVISELKFISVTQ